MNYTLMILLADTAKVTEDALPSWGKYVLGPLGCLVLLLVYAVYTERYRIPQLHTVIKGMKTRLCEMQERLDALGEKHSIKKDEIRAKAETREDELEVEVRRLRDKISKEKSARAWWQAKATGAFKRLKEDLSIPEDIDKTHYDYGGSGS